ncbi:MAG: DHH family phosphoesterase [Candidatus Sumerlaeia bacterium]
MHLPENLENKRTYQSDREAIQDILKILDAPENQNFLICGHLRPDGDCLGSIMALYHLLQGKGKDARIFFKNINAENLLQMLPDQAAPDPEFPADYPADVTLCLDVAESDRITDNFEETARGLIVNIDHHISNSEYAALNWVKPHASATGEMIVQLIDAEPSSWTPEIANALYIAIATDTGSFRYGNTTSECLYAAAHLVDMGADVAACANLAWGNRNPEEIQLAATVLSNMHFEMEGKFAWSEITQETFLAHGGEANDPESLSGDMRSIRGVEVAALIRESPEGHARASLRSSGRVNVSEIAASLGGGGHRAAAGLTVDGPYVQGREKILKALRQGILEQMQNLME